MTTSLGFPLASYLGGVQFTSVLSARQWVKDTIELEFASLMLVNSAFLATSSYAVTSSIPTEKVQVLFVRPFTPTVAKLVNITVSNLTVGATYTVTISTNLVNTQGAALSGTSNKVKFVAALSKVDNAVGSRPNLYSTDTASTFRNVLNGIFREDDLIGGARKYTAIETIVRPTPPVAPTRVQYISSSTVTSSGVDGPTISLPPLLENNDLMVLAVCVQAIDTEIGSIDTPAGWTLLTLDTNTSGCGNASGKQGVYYKLASSEPTTLAISLSGFGGTPFTSAAVANWRNVDQGTPIETQGNTQFYNSFTGPTFHDTVEVTPLSSAEVGNTFVAILGTGRGNIVDVNTHVNITSIVNPPSYTLSTRAAVASNLRIWDEPVDIVTTADDFFTVSGTFDGVDAGSILYLCTFFIIKSA